MSATLAERALVASNQGSRAYSASGKESSGRTISIKSPGQTVVEEEGARSTCARRTALWVGGGLTDP